MKIHLEGILGNKYEYFKYYFRINKRLTKYLKTVNKKNNILVRIDKNTRALKYYKILIRNFKKSRMPKKHYRHSSRSDSRSVRL